MLAAQDYFQITCTSLNKEILAHPSFLHGPRKRLHFAFTIPKQTNGSAFILVFKRKNKVSWSSFFIFVFWEVFFAVMKYIRIKWQIYVFNENLNLLGWRILYIWGPSNIFLCVYIYMLYNILFSILLFHSCLVGV